MKKTAILILIVTLNISLAAQSFETLCADYVVHQEILHPETRKPVANVKLTGKMIKNGNRYIYYEKPAYLEEYPEGKINIVTSYGSNSLIAITSDSISSISYWDLDSMVFRSHSSFLGKAINDFFRIGEGKGGWKLSDKTRDFHGITAQEAVYLDSSGITKRTAWVNPLIPVVCGPSDRHIPGLVLSQNFPRSYKTAELVRYEEGCAINEELFWPEQFNLPFRDRGNSRYN